MLNDESQCKQTQQESEPSRGALLGLKVVFSVQSFLWPLFPPFFPCSSLASFSRLTLWPRRLQQLLEEREREEREEVVVEEVEDARFVRASTLLLPFPSFPCFPIIQQFFFLPFFMGQGGGGGRCVPRLKCTHHFPETLNKCLICLFNVLFSNNMSLDGKIPFFFSLC